MSPIDYLYDHDANDSDGQAESDVVGDLVSEQY